MNYQSVYPIITSLVEVIQDSKICDELFEKTTCLYENLKRYKLYEYQSITELTKLDLLSKIYENLYWRKLILDKYYSIPYNNIDYEITYFMPALIAEKEMFVKLRDMQRNDYSLEYIDQFYVSEMLYCVNVSYKAFEYLLKQIENV